MTTFEFEKHIKVTTLDIKWDLYWALADEVAPMLVLDEVNQCLTEWAIVALERRDPELFWKETERFAKYGAADSEPIWQFRDLWMKAYGEDI